MWPLSPVAPCAGLVLRVITTFFAMGLCSGSQYNWKDKVFLAVAWTPKATVQAALSAVPLAMINENLADSPDLEQWQIWGEELLVTGIFAIIVCGTLGSLMTGILSPLLLDKPVSISAHCMTGIVNSLLII